MVEGRGRREMVIDVLLLLLLLLLLARVRMVSLIHGGWVVEGDDDSL